MNDNVIVIADVSSSYFSVARYSGGIKYNGTVYIYCRERDILVREDWEKFYRKLPWETFITAVKTGKKPELPKSLQGLRLREKNNPIINHHYLTNGLTESYTQAEEIPHDNAAHD